MPSNSLLNIKMGSVLIHSLLYYILKIYANSSDFEIVITRDYE